MQQNHPSGHEQGLGKEMLLAVGRPILASPSPALVVNHQNRRSICYEFDHNKFLATEIAKIDLGDSHNL